MGREVEIDYLVMEYLEGETLAQRLARVAFRTEGGVTRTPTTPSPATPGVAGSPAMGHGRRGAPLRLGETLRIGIELAEALAAAHKAGIIPSLPSDPGRSSACPSPSTIPRAERRPRGPGRPQHGDHNDPAVRPVVP